MTAPLDAQEQLYMHDLIQAVEKWLKSKHNLENQEILWGVEQIKTEQRLRRWQRVARYPGIDYNNINICCGYLHRFASCHSALARHVVLLAMTEQPNGKLAQLLAKTKCLKIASVGGGPGNDILGFCNGIKDFVLNLEELHLTVVDLKGAWKDVFYQIMAEVPNGDRYGKLGEFFQNTRTRTHVYNFVQQDLCDGVPYEVGEAHLVLMVKVLSNVSNFQKTSILTNIFQAMKPGAIFVYIDINAVFVGSQGYGRMTEVFTKYQRQIFPYYISSESIWRSSYEICILRKRKPRGFSIDGTKP